MAEHLQQIPGQPFIRVLIFELWKKPAHRPVVVRAGWPASPWSSVRSHGAA